ncbi:MFS transporter [Duganella sp. Leaf61]|uniref:MFS transporter n=2 Tax=Pseudomonadota TaxID=1224 RepID=UPI0006F2F71F|nr:MFS transporter [Duganella sp. Leaf61]KQN70224.1 MFS transporter [Duganella sp. Leaf61]
MTNADVIKEGPATPTSPPPLPRLPDAAADAVYRKVLWRLMPLLMLCYVVSFIDRSNIGFAKLHFVHDLGFTETIYGIGAGIFYVGYILFEVPSNMYLHRVGVRATLLRIMVLWGLCSAAMAFMTTPLSFYLMRLLLGAAEAGLFPGMLLYLTYWVPLSRRARFTALFTMSIPIAGMIGGPLSGWLIHAFEGVGGMRGWQWLFIVEGLPACFIGIFAYFYLQNSPAASSWLSTDEKALIQRDFDAENLAKKAKTRHSFKEALREPRLYWLAGMGVGVLVSTGGVFFWLPSIIRKSGIDNVFTIGLLSVIPFCIALFAQYFNARHSDKTGERRWHVALPALVAAAGWLALPSVHDSTALSVLMLTLVTAGTLSLTGPFWTLPSTFLSGAAAAGGIAVLSATAGLGSVFSPILVGWLASQTGNLMAGQYYFGSVLALGAISLLIGVRPDAAAAK